MISTCFRFDQAVDLGEALPVALGSLLGGEVFVYTFLEIKSYLGGGGGFFVTYFAHFWKEKLGGMVLFSYIFGKESSPWRNGAL